MTGGNGAAATSAATPSTRPSPTLLAFADAVTTDTVPPTTQPQTLAAPFAVKLANGVTVELVAVALEDGPKPSRWWQPDGAPTDAAPFADFPTLGYMGELEGDQKPYRIAYRIASSDESAGIMFNSNPKHGGARMWLNPLLQKPKNRTGITEAKVYQPADATTMSLQIGVATGEWKTAAVANPDGTIVGNAQRLGNPATAATGGDNVADVKLSKVTDDPKGNRQYGQPAGATIVLDVPSIERPPVGADDVAPRDFVPSAQLVAITATGTEVQGREFLATNNTNGTREIDSYTFAGLKASDVNRLEYRTRPYHWVEFRGVSLVADGVSEVTAVTDQESAAKCLVPNRGC
jgi:hypothetical protein